LERWLSLCEREKWGDVPARMETLAQVFGSSWYFTRFIFFQGKCITTLFDDPDLPDISYQGMLEKLYEIPQTDDLEARL
ncbi:MAG: hypothetical protein GWO08_18310, partial [Gammaproteobacteria bacterium]|nr:hypothetical protein [Gammaproteobacteria bacterium]NIR95520.1 hypothetical protein [Gammaproteobacteria bacterium]NIW44282.1 hypothetical protein [Gammaproteobacteria bacterium]NIX55442.1 hypothetical protein [candidate division Zixibacteria bacterium]